MPSTPSPKCLPRWAAQLTLRNADWDLRRSAPTNQPTASHHQLQVAYVVLTCSLTIPPWSH